ncbi:transposase [Bradyrhizobium yuanmingense]|uniref:IS5 family transposase n=1 Tax=Bradyrhizobium yuanmingense TaxID=108015 RepID=UPI0035182BDB
MRRYALRDDQWERIKDFLPGREGHVGGTAADNRLFVDAVLYRYRAGIPWRDLPERFGHWKVVYQRFSRWSKSGVFERIFKLLASDHDNEYMMITPRSYAPINTVLARTKNGDQAIGRSRGGLSTKIHALVDALGNPVELMLSPGQANDLTCAEPLLANSDPAALMGDKAYDADAFIQTLTARQITPVIPSHPRRAIPLPCDFALYCERNLVERFFNKLKHFRAIATRYDKLARNFLAGVYLASAFILLN